MKRQRIWILTRHYPPDGGAPSFRMQHLAQALAESHDVTVLAAQPNRYGTEPSAPKREVVDGVTIRRVPNGGNVKWSGKLGRVLSESLGAMIMTFSALLHVGRADVVVATVPPLAYALPGWASKRLRRRRLVLDVRDLWLDWAEETGMVRRALPRRMLRAFERSVVQAADRLTVTTHGFAEALAKRFEVPHGRLTVVYNGLDDALAPTPGDTARPKPGEPVTVLYAGNLGPSQNLLGITDGLVASLDRWPNLTISIVGNGVQARALGAIGHDRLQTTRAVDRQRLRRLYEDADAFLLHLASLEVYRHTVPSKTFEYAAYGKPLLCGVRGEARDIASSHADCYFFESDDPVSVADAVDRLASGAEPDNGAEHRSDPSEILRSARTPVWQRVFEGLE